eukprot:CAMPEP_0118943856 /NCGR_PEP_ID=MMETSP1169-20130426/39181_1 /TAXON_ID=36882 /ORGANISM="Pyramimonas obovata, Strain CCMP722" /LENGTH=561 /DNA_ID=CAMNT_0006889211 /DNA_START=400 /DNA_END=2086 /DNA_ORIENTATION=-
MAKNAQKVEHHRRAPCASACAPAAEVRVEGARAQELHAAGVKIMNLTLRNPPSYTSDWSLGYPSSSKFQAQYETDWNGPVLGRGSFGVVRKATGRDGDGKEYAVKTLEKMPSVGGRIMKKIQNETSLILELGASLDVGYCYGVWEDEAEVHMLLELCRGGDLSSRAGSYSEAEVMRIISSVLRVVAQCHAKNYVHRDIKPENFMFLTEADDSPIRAIDFGLATAITPGVDLEDRCGTVHYCAPEVILYKYGKEADLWSVGVLAHQLLTGTLPFTDANNPNETNEERFDAILNKDLNLDTAAWNGISDQAKAFVHSLLTRDRQQRLSAVEALEHGWLQGGCTNGSECGSMVQRLQRFGTYSQFTQLVMQEMARKMMTCECSDLQGLRELFDKLDPHGVGLVSPEAMHTALTRDGYILSEEEFDQLTQCMERLCSTFADKKRQSGGECKGVKICEFVAAFLDWSRVELEGGENWVSLAEYAFKQWDHTGVLDIERLGDMIAELNAEKLHSQRAVENKLKSVDADGDKRVSWAEFLSLIEPEICTENLAVFDSRYASRSNLLPI